jgi:hypothetical protein
MKAIRFNKLKSSTIVELVAMIGVDTNPNSKVYIGTERPQKNPSDYTIEELTTLLMLAKQAKLAEDARTFEFNNRELYEYIKYMIILEYDNHQRDDMYDDFSHDCY